MIKNKYEVVAIGLREGEIADVKIETEKRYFKGIDTVTFYLNPKRQQEYYKYIISLKSKRVIFNPGTDTEFIKCWQKILSKLR